MRFSQIRCAAALAGVFLVAACNAEPTELRVDRQPPSSSPGRQGAMAPEAKQKQTEKRAESKKEYDEALARLEARGVKPKPQNQKDDERKLAPTAHKKSLPKGSYKTYDSAAVAAGQVIVLFFHSAWSPKSDMDDKMLTTWYDGTERPLLTVYKVDVDAEAELKKQYKVADTPTYVKLDTHGRVLDSVFAPSAQELNVFLNSARAQ